MLSEELTAKLEELSRSIPSLTWEGETLTVDRESLLALLSALKDDPVCDFNFLTNLTATDFGDHLTVVYNLVSFSRGHTLEVKCDLPGDNAEIPSAVPVFMGADWQEREVYDLLGVTFTGRGELKRILLHEGFEGHPLRKDYKWAGGRQ